MRLADYVLQFLKNRGIDTAFTVCGGGAIFLCDALAKSGMRYVACHHEQAAAMAAESYARVRNGLGLAIVTSGPGGTNAATGVAGAWTDHVPTITISGQVFSNQTINGREGLRTVGVQEINIVDIVRPITKYAVMIKDPKRIRHELEKAVWLAREGRRARTSAFCIDRGSGWISESAVSGRSLSGQAREWARPLLWSLKRPDAM